ncbi:uncharacterized protein METZ01_LOCUS162879 [marine metagenome]|uniref:Uncharacterized protein n=1 Tax=marine metagenome TaxID=408172 RepID=A0A382B8A3_9ZZZZ
MLHTLKGFIFLALPVGVTLDITGNGEVFLKN